MSGAIAVVWEAPSNWAQQSPWFQEFLERDGGHEDRTCDKCRAHVPDPLGLVIGVGEAPDGETAVLQAVVALCARCAAAEGWRRTAAP